MLRSESSNTHPYFDLNQTNTCSCKRSSTVVKVFASGDKTAQRRENRDQSPSEALRWCKERVLSAAAGVALAGLLAAGEAMAIPVWISYP